MEPTFICEHCGESFPMSEVHYVGDAQICESCADEETVICSHCGERVWRDDNAGDEDTPLCQRCYDENYTTCSRCGAIIRNDDAHYAHEDDDEPLCASCYASRRCSSGIRDYYYKPEPIFHGDAPRYMGVELEVDGAGEYGENAERILDIGNADGELVYCKHDGSLNSGFEIVSHPCSLDYHLNVFPWPDILREAREMGYTSHQAGTCGLHIHVSREAFGSNAEEQDACIARVLYFFEKHWGELLKFSRRTRRQLEQWANRYGLKEHPKEILDNAKAGNYRNRYTCVNLTNTDTVEFRMFRGTLKLNTFRATLQFVNRVCDAALSLSDDEMKNLSWTNFVSDCESPELVQYLKERRLYINEPIQTEAEV